MASENEFIPEPLTEEQLRRLLTEAIDRLEDFTNPETFHAIFGHVDRGIQTDDVLFGLERPWHFERPPVFNKKEWQWKYRLATQSIDGDAITIIVAVDSPRGEFWIVTRWRNTKE